MGEPQTVDLSNCDREPIHIPGSIQPHGCLIVCDEALQTIMRSSENAGAFLGKGEASLRGRKLLDLFDAVPGHATDPDERGSFLLGPPPRQR